MAEKTKAIPRKKAEDKSTLATQFGFTRYLNNSQATQWRIGAVELRNLARANPFVSVAINKVKQRVVRSVYVIRPKDPTKKPDEFREHIEYIENLLANPNQQNDTYRTLVSKTLDDLLVLDQGVWEKVKNLKGEVVELYHVDGASIRENRDKYGYFESPAYLQFLPLNSSPQPDATFEQDEIMYFQANPQSGDLLGKGYSPVEMVVGTVIAGIQAMLYNTTYFSESAAPPFIVNLKGVGTDEIKQFKIAFESELRGNPHANAFTNAENLEIAPLRPNNQEMQFYELNLWLARVVISAFDLSPQDFGLTMDVNKSTSESQEKVSRDGGIATYLDLIQEEINKDLIGDLANYDPKFGELTFEYIKVRNLEEEKTQAEIDSAQVKNGTRTANELRQRDGLDPLEVEVVESQNKADLEKARKLASFYG